MKNRDNKHNMVIERQLHKINQTQTGKIGVHEVNCILLSRIADQLTELAELPREQDKNVAYPVLNTEPPKLKKRWWKR